MSTLTKPEAHKKRRSLSLQDKFHIVKRVQDGEKHSTIAKHFGVQRSTVSKYSSTITQQEVIQQFHQSGAVLKKKKRIQTGKFVDIERELFSWISYHQLNSPHFRISYELIQLHTKHIINGILERLLPLHGTSLPYVQELQAFKVSEKWVQKFCARHNVMKHILHGESGGVKQDIVNEGRMQVNQEVQSYPLNSIYNIDETGLFYRLLPNTTLASQAVRGMKQDKSRITVLLGCNADGSHKLKPMVVGKHLNPRCFKGVNKSNLPCMYRANETAWMNAGLFREYLNYVNEEMIKLDRKIVMLIDGAGAHGGMDRISFSHMKLLFLPANTTSHLQPMDAGIICNTKAYYKKI